MKAGWETKTLGDVCEFVRGPFGGSLKKSVFVKDGFAVYEQQHAIYDQFDEIRYFIDETKFKEMRRFELHPNDLIMSCSGTMGRVAIVPGNIRPGIINQALLKLTPSRVVSAMFLKYWMDGDGFQDSLKEQSGGAAIQNVASVSVLKEIKIPLPPLPEQQRIVAILDEAFDGIATAKANAEKNLQNARALFESHLHTIFTLRGEGWVENTLDQICIIGDGNHSSNYPRKEELVEAGISFIRATNLVDGRISDIDMRFISPQKHAQLKKGHLKSGDILITNRGEIGKTALVDDAFDNANLNSQIAWLRCREGMENRFLFHVLNSPEVQDHFQSAKSGTALQQFTIKQLKELKIPTPPKCIQQTVIAALDTLADETRRLESIYRQKLAALDALKQSLLHRAFNGDL